MEPVAFVQKLAEAAPSATNLEKAGFSSEEAGEFRKHYFCEKRGRPLAKLGGSDLVLELLRNWDLGRVQIGMVRFPEPPVEHSGKICIGCVEADPLVIQPSNGEIVVHEFGTTEHLLWYVSKSGSNLLAALLIAAKFLERRGSGAIDFGDYTAARSVALECASAAGGDRYLDFYKMLLGAE